MDASGEVLDLLNAAGVLVVEDSVPQRMVAVEHLRALGVSRIEEAGDGRAALQRLTELSVPPAVMLVDLEMPGMDGVELLHRVAAAGYRPGVIIASSREAQLIESVDSMVTDMGLTILGALSKPLTGDMLRTALGSLCASPRQIAGERPYAPEEVSPFDLAVALDQGLVVPWFQPKVDLNSALPRGAEVLARWVCADGSLIEPGRFIGVAERSGLMPRLTLHMLDASLQALSRWDRRGLRLSLAINLSPVTLDDSQLADQIVARVAATGIAPSRITLEVTETAMTQGASALTTLLRLKLNGFSLAIDDFGTGFSSMQQLSRIPFSELKIDRSIVHEAYRRPARRTILESAIEMGRRLGMVTVAEGLERVEDWILLRSLGCVLAQGYFMSRPVAEDRLVDVTTGLHRALQSRLAGKGVEAG